VLWKRRKNSMSSITFTNVQNWKNGVYTAHWWYENQQKISTFFPSEWEGKMVEEKILEAYNNPILRENSKTGKYIIQGLTAEGLIIEMLITNKGTVKVAYPIIIRE
jgi:hypothetical protein